MTFMEGDYFFVDLVTFVLIPLIGGVFMFTILYNKFKSSYSHKRIDKIEDSKYFFCKDCNVEFEGKVNDAIHYGHYVISTRGSKI